MNGTREFITVYSGELTLIFKDHEYVLKAGDAASYNALMIMCIKYRKGNGDCQYCSTLFELERSNSMEDQKQRVYDSVKQDGN